MEIHGQVQNGVVVLDGGAILPEGVRVIVSYQAPAAGPPGVPRRSELPLVHTGQPGSVNLSGERIAEILEAEEIAALRDMWHTPARHRPLD